MFYPPKIQCEIPIVNLSQIRIDDACMRLFDGNFRFIQQDLKECLFTLAEPFANAVSGTVNSNVTVSGYYPASQVAGSQVL